VSVNLEELTKPFPTTAHKQRPVGGGRNVTYVEGHTVIHRLNSACPEWHMTIKSLDSIDVGNNTQQVTAHVALTIPGLGTREHVGVQDVRQGSPDLVKGAVTDALKKAATLFGVGLELYGPDYEAGEVEQPRRTAPPAERQQRPHDTRQQAPQQQRPQPTPGGMTDPQRRRLFGYIAPMQNMSEEDVRCQVFLRFGKHHIHEITKMEASQLMDFIEAGDLLQGSVPPLPRTNAQEANQQGYGVPEEPTWVRGAPGLDKYTA
jgi:hypothetical protein